MAENKVSFVVITPEREVISGDADSVVLPAHDGELGVLPRRAPLMCELGVGEFRFRVGTAVYRLFLDGGFAQVFENRVTILTGQAYKAADISDAMVRAAEEQAKSDPDPEIRSRAVRRLSVLKGLRDAG